MNHPATNDPGGNDTHHTGLQPEHVAGVVGDPEHSQDFPRLEHTLPSRRFWGHDLDVGLRGDAADDAYEHGVGPWPPATRRADAPCERAWPWPARVLRGRLERRMKSETGTGAPHHSSGPPSCGVSRPVSGSGRSRTLARASMNRSIAAARSGPIGSLERTVSTVIRTTSLPRRLPFAGPGRPSCTSATSRRRRMSEAVTQCSFMGRRSRPDDSGVTRLALASGEQCSSMARAAELGQRPHLLEPG